MNASGWPATVLAALVLAGCGAGGGGDGGSDSDDSEAAAASGGSGGGGADCSPGSVDARAAEVLEGRLEPGKHSTGQLATEVTFALEGPWRAPDRATVPGGLVLQAKEPPAPYTRFLLLMRNFELHDAGATGKDPDAVLAAHPEVEVVEARDTTVGGSDARVFDLTMETSNRPLLDSEVGGQGLAPRDFGRLWIIDQEGTSPLGIFAVVGKQDTQWLDTTAESVVESIELGEPAELDVTAARACQVQAAAARSKHGSGGGSE